MRFAWICVVALLGAKALAEETSPLHDDEAVPANHAMSKRHVQPIFDRINRFLGTGTPSTTIAPETEAQEKPAPAVDSTEVIQPAREVPTEVSSAAVVPKVDAPTIEGPVSEEPQKDSRIEGSTIEGPTTPSILLPATEVSASDTSAEGSTNVIPGNDASPPQEGLKADEERHRLRRSFETLRTIDHLAHLPHQKLEGFLRSLPGGKFVVEDHYDATAPKPFEELEKLFEPAPTVGKTVSINKKVEIKLPTKTISKEITIEKGGLSKILDHIKSALKGLTTHIPITTPPPPVVLPPKALPPPVAPPALPVVVVPPPKPVPPPVVVPVQVEVVTTTAPPDIEVVTTDKPLLEASITKTVKIPVNEPKPEEATR